MAGTGGFGGSGDDRLLHGPFALPAKNFAGHGINKTGVSMLAGAANLAVTSGARAGCR